MTSTAQRVLGLSSYTAILTIITLLVSLLLPAPATAAGTISEIEPNSTTASAQAVPLDTTIQAGFRRTGDCDNTFYDCDVYRFSATHAGQLLLDLQFADTLGTSSSLRLTVQDSSGAQIYSHEVSSADYDGTRLRKFALFVGAGTFYVTLKARVSGFSTGYVWSQQPYTLSANVTPGVVETESNRTTATADVIGLGQRIAGSTFTPDCNNNFDDCDYYRLQLTSATRLRVDFRFACGLGTDRLYTLSTYDNLGTRLSSTPLYGANCDGAALRAAPISAPAGNFYVLVQSRARGIAQGIKYTLAVSGLFTTTSVPVVEGTVKVGSTLSAKLYGWKPSPTTIRYQWLRNGVAITDAKSSVYKLTIADAGKKISVKITALKAGFVSVGKVSVQKAVPLLTLTTATPTISGTSTVGSTLRANPGAWGPSPVTFRYAWLRDGVAITGATSQSYTLVRADRGKQVRVKVVGSKTGYKSVAKYSASRFIR
jgi:hypothetical protein